MEDFFAKGRRSKEKKALEPTYETAPSQALQRNAPTDIANKPVKKKPKRSSEPIQATRSDGAPFMGRGERKTYPERTFDSYAPKACRFRPEDIDLLKIFASEISRARKDEPSLRSLPRVTDNTVIRLLISSFCEKIEGTTDNLDFRGLQTEAEVKNYIEETMGF
jgi:hypothetical protein